MTPPRGRSGPLIATKLLPPPLPNTAVERPRLITMLDTQTQVVLVVAAPGYGKTTSVRQWYEGIRHEVDIGWVSCDALDESAQTFWNHVVAALRAASPAIDHEPADILDERGVFDGAFLAALIEQILTSTRTLILVIDDLHRVVDRRALALLELLIDRTNGSLRAIICTRTDPALPIARWRAEDRLREIRAADLAFRPGESAAYFAAIDDLHLDDASVVSLSDRVEGWAIGLRLMALMLQGRADVEAAVRDVVAHPGLVGDYLVSELLSQLPADVGQAALMVSVLDPIELNLAVETLGTDSVRDHVRALSAANVFLAPLTGSQEVYRFHPLVRELLELELQRRHPTMRKRLHRDAARLFTERGDVDHAFTHLLAVGDIDQAIDLVLGLSIQVTDAGATERLAGWLNRLGPMSTTNPVRALDIAQSLILVGRMEDATTWCDRAVAAYDGDFDRTGLLRIHLQRLIIAGGIGDTSTARAEIEHFTEVAAGQPVETRFERRFPLVMARIAIMDGALDLAEAALNQAVDHDDIIPRTVTVPGLWCWLHLERGEMLAALRRGRESVDAAARLGTRQHYGSFDGLLSLATVHLVMGDVQVAGHLAEAAAEELEFIDPPLYRFRAGLLAARIAELHDPAAALDVIEHLDERLRRRVTGVVLRDLNAAHARALLRCARPVEAEAFLQHLDDGPVGRLARARHALATHHFADVTSRLGDPEYLPLIGRVEGLTLMALAETGRNAERTLEAALSLAAPNQIHLPFLSEGDELLRLLDRVDVASIAPELDDRLRHDRTEQLAPRRLLIDPLTDREREVLQLLTTHLTYSGIAERTFVSANTVKTHVKAVYRKLGAASRADAVAIGRNTGLIV